MEKFLCNPLEMHVPHFVGRFGGSRERPRSSCLTFSRLAYEPSPAALIDDFFNK